MTEKASPQHAKYADEPSVASSIKLQLICPYEEATRNLDLTTFWDNSHVVLSYPVVAKKPRQPIAFLFLTLALSASPIAWVVWQYSGWPIVFAMWAVAVLGPPIFWWIIPDKMLQPTHLMRYDSATATLSVNGGNAVLRRDEIVGLLSISDRRRRRTELQVVWGDPETPWSHFIVNCRELDPSIAFGTALLEFAKFTGIPFYMATIDAQAGTTLELVPVEA